nr:hypothetical protein [Ferrimicrobium acidiphilum]
MGFDTMKKIEDMTEAEFFLYLSSRRRKIKDPKLRELFVQIQQAYYAASGALLHLAEAKPNMECLTADVRGMAVHVGRAAGITGQSVARIVATDKRQTAVLTQSTRRRRE